MLAVVCLSSCAATPTPGAVEVLTAHGDINPVMANYLRHGIAEAAGRHAQAVLVQLDTPGGLDASMREIVQAIDNATVPVIVYVSPAGARAASAGTFITMAAHVAAMAPNTAIGAAHPVSASGGDITGTLGEKVTNDAVAYIRGIAELRGRNADWAEQAVRQTVSVPETQAVQLHVVDLAAPSVNALLRAVDGRQVSLGDGQTVELHTTGAVVEARPMSPFDQFLMLLSDPNIAYLLLAFGFVAFVLEFFHHTIILGIAGALSLIVGLLALGTLPIDWAGVALLALAAILLLAELVVGTYGVLGLVGLVALAGGGLLLTGTSSGTPHVSRWLALLVPSVVGAMLAWLILFMLRVRRRAVAVGAESLVGRRGQARSALDPEGFVMIRGERWQARAPQPVAAGAWVVVTGRDGLRLTVEPLPGADQPGGPSEPGGAE